MKIAVLLTCFNRKEKTLACLRSLYDTHEECKSPVEAEVFLTDDGSSDGTSEAVSSLSPFFPLTLLKGDGSLFWRGGMNNSWRAAINKESFDGYLWLNDDCVVLKEFWDDLLKADEYSVTTYGKRGIYVGSTCEPDRETFSYGGFNYINKWTLKDELIHPDGKSFQECQCAHGNITYVSHEVVEQRGVLCDEYHHGGADHDYTYLAHCARWPVLILPHYAAICENNHIGKTGAVPFRGKKLRDRLTYLKSSAGLNLNNTLLFQKRCFPHRYLPVLFTAYLKAIFPKLGSRLYLFIRGVK